MDEVIKAGNDRPFKVKKDANRREVVDKQAPRC